MRVTYTKNHWVASAALCLLIQSPAHAGSAPSAKNPKNPELEAEAAEESTNLIWRIGAGAAWRRFDGVKFSSGSFSPGFARNIFSLAQRGQRSGRVGSSGSFADRLYDDGFVFTDAATRNPNSFLPGTTSNWGYNNDSQVSGGNLTYRGDGGSRTQVSKQSSESGASWAEDDIDAASPVINIDVLYPVNETLRIGGEFGFMYANFDASNRGSTFSGRITATRESTRVTDVYDLQGVVPPSAPYSGTFGINFSEPLIDNIPTSRSVSRSVDSVETVDFFNRVDESVDVDAFLLSVGTKVEKQWGKVFVDGAAGLGVNVVNWDASYDETLFSRRNGGTRREVASWEDRSSGTDVLLSFYLQASVGIDLSERVSAQIFGRYDWTEELRESVGPSDFSVDLSGPTAGAMIGIKF